jgi:hypothetical protein
MLRYSANCEKMEYELALIEYPECTATIPIIMFKAKGSRMPR